MTVEHMPKEKQRQREQIKKDIEAFIAKGGTWVCERIYTAAELDQLPGRN